MKQGRLDACRRSGGLADEAEINPMDGLSNLADVMLVLAVGIMLALVVAWNVDISLAAPGEAEQEEEMTAADSLQQVTLDENTEPMPGDGSGLMEYGRAYVDTDGNFYVLEDNREEEEP